MGFDEWWRSRIVRPIGIEPLARNAWNKGQEAERRKIRALIDHHLDYWRVRGEDRARGHIYALTKLRGDIK